MKIKNFMKYLKEGVLKCFKISMSGVRYLKTVTRVTRNKTVLLQRRNTQRIDDDLFGQSGPANDADLIERIGRT